MSEPWFDPNTFGGILGSIFGFLGGAVYGPLVGYCSPKGKLKGFVLGYHITLLVVSIGLVAVGGYAYFVGQPNGISFALIGVGIGSGIIYGGLTPVVLKRYKDADALSKTDPRYVNRVYLPLVVTSNCQQKWVSRRKRDKCRELDRKRDWNMWCCVRCLDVVEKR